MVIEESVTATAVITTGHVEMITAQTGSHHLGVQSIDRFLLIVAIEAVTTERAATLANAADPNRPGITVEIHTDAAVVVHIGDTHRGLI